MLFVDTSVVVALYVPEPGSRRVQRLFADADDLAICPITEIEFASAVSRLLRMRAIPKEAARRLLDQFADHVREPFYTFYPLTQEVYDLAREWVGSFETSLRTLDAIQLAAAHVNDAPMLTADKALTAIPASREPRRNRHPPRRQSSGRNPPGAVSERFIPRSVCSTGGSGGIRPRPCCSLGS